MLELQYKGEKQPHAYLFTGPDGVGKKTLALEFSQKLLGTERLENHPDFQILEGGDLGTVENVREFIRNVHFKPSVANVRVAIINNAHSLNVQSHNALLKTFEEPPEYMRFFLISSEFKLLATIMSRCQVLAFSKLSPQELETIAKEHGWKSWEKALILSYGSASKLKQLTENPEALSNAQKQNEFWHSLKKMPLHERLLEINTLSVLETEDLQAQFTAWLYAESLNACNSSDSVVFGRSLLAALKYLRTNKNKKLIIQNLLTQFP